MKTINIIPELKGTEKQIAWAKEIRDFAIAQFDRLAAMPAADLGFATEADKDAMIRVACIGLSREERDALRTEIEHFESSLPAPGRKDPSRGQILADNRRKAYDFVLGKAAEAFEKIDSAAAWIEYKKSY